MSTGNTVGAEKIVGLKGASMIELYRPFYKVHLDTIEKLMFDLENIGHAKVDFVEGLTVELLDFQRQTVQFALEREWIPGGIQRLFWMKLPCDDPAIREIYYNPILQRFREDKPRLVRGGFIAEEMGLGKTVISLALILTNPAPMLPKSGSKIGCLRSLEWNTEGNSKTGRDPDFYSRTSASNPKRGSIISRGTLVIVSSD